MRILDGPRAIFEGIRAGINGSTVLRHIRNRRLFPGLYLHPTVNHALRENFVTDPMSPFQRAVILSFREEPS